MIALDPNFRDLLSCLNSADVRYLVVGGYAVNYHGYHRNTKDIDIWVAAEPENASRVSTALRAFGFSPRSVRSSLFLDLGTVHSFGREPLRVDLLAQPSGVEFQACYERRIEADVDGVRVPFIGLEDLIANKAASGRTQDFADLEKLRKTKSAPGARPARKSKREPQSGLKKRRRTK
jgi:predicted nucleotidyltransferase